PRVRPAVKMLDSSPLSRYACQASLFRELESYLPGWVVLRVLAKADSHRRQDKRPAQPESFRTARSDIATHTRVPKQLPTSDRPAPADPHRVMQELDEAGEPDTQH